MKAKRGKRMPKEAAPKPAATPLWKVLVNGRSCHGGDMAYSLPGGDKPGDWHEVPSVELCRQGFHLTDAPAWWWRPGCTIYLAEAEGVEGECSDANSRKVVARRVRLLREATADEMTALRIFSAGSHTVTDGRSVAWGSASVVARDSASVEAWDSARVEARGSARVVAWDSASVEARGSARVEARGSARVVAWDSASVEAWDSARVEARGSARVVAWDSVTIVSWWGKPGVRIQERAVWVERGDGSAAPVVHVAVPGEEQP